jgi:hypothetical protein
MMKKVLVGVAVAVLGFAVIGYAEEAAAPSSPAVKGACCATAGAPAVCHVCEKCQTCEKAAGKCPKCQGELKAMHVLAVKDGTCILCACAADCKCTLSEDGAKCSCGKDVVKIAKPAEKKAD